MSVMKSSTSHTKQTIHLQNIGKFEHRIGLRKYEYTGSIDENGSIEIDMSKDNTDI
jgi:hypothetical protein